MIKYTVAILGFLLIGLSASQGTSPVNDSSRIESQITKRVQNRLLKMDHYSPLEAIVEISFVLGSEGKIVNARASGNSPLLNSRIEKSILGLKVIDIPFPSALASSEYRLKVNFLKTS